MASRSFLILLFSLSVLWRLPFLDRPLSRHHESITAHALKPLQIWHKEGGLKYHFNHVLTYSNQGDKFVKDESSSIMDPEGNFYYVSRPPLSIILPHFVHRLLGIAPTVLTLQVFNLGLHFLDSLLIYLFLAELGAAPLLGVVLYLFSPVTLWFHSNAYAAESLFQTFFIFGVFCFLKWQRESPSKGPWASLLAVTVFLMIYTDWLGIFFTATLLLPCLFLFRRPEYKKLFCYITAAALLSLTLVLWQFSHINGFEVFFSYVSQKFLRRAAVAQGVTIFFQIASWKNVVVYYLAAHLPALLFLILLIFLFLRRRLSFRGFFKSEEKKLLALAFLPPLLFDGFFFDVTIHHAFFPLKSTLGIILVIVFLYRKIEAGLHRGRAAVIFAGLTVVSLLQFWWINRLPDSRYQNIGMKIKELAKPEEVVFIDPPSFYPHPQILVYAQRNAARWEGEEKAAALFKKNGARQGVIFTLNEKQTAVERVRHFFL